MGDSSVIFTGLTYPEGGVKGLGVLTTITVVPWCTWQGRLGERVLDSYRSIIFLLSAFPL